MTTIFESEVEEATLEWLKEIGWRIAYGPTIAPDSSHSERENYTIVHLEQKLRDTLHRLNSNLSTPALDDAYRKLTRLEGTTLETRNREFHRMSVNGVTVEYRTTDGAVRGAVARIFDFDDPSNNDWLAVNQFTVVENTHERRPDRGIFEGLNH